MTERGRSESEPTSPSPFRFSGSRRLLEVGDNAYLDYASLEEDQASLIFQECEKLEFEQRPKIAGTTYSLKRDVQIFSDTVPGYEMSKQSRFVIPSKPCPPFLRNLLVAINSHFQEDFNLVLINAFYNESDSVGPHVDDVYGQGIHGIVTISVGETRTYQMIDIKTSQVIVAYEMKHGDVLIMSNDLQKTHFHAVPALTVREVGPLLARKCGKRFSITTRRVIPGREFQMNRKPYQFVNCIKCKKVTHCRSQVCQRCYDKKLFTCEKCGDPVGAPWPCDKCWVRT